MISRAKLFSGAATDFGAPPNTQVSFVDAAFPGMLPVINRECVAQAVRTGLGLNAHINLVSRFDRKNYFYADLPAGYQISQYQHPIVGEGRIEIELADGSTREIGITRLHLEQDAGKSLHDQHPTKSYIDLNRAGVALMEIVSEPDIRSPGGGRCLCAQAAHHPALSRHLRRQHGGRLHARRCQRVGAQARRAVSHPLRGEERQLGSLRHAGDRGGGEAADRGVGARQRGRAGNAAVRSAARGSTRSMRSKEDAHDYRYFPDPDLLPLVLDEAWVAELKAKLPELPDAKKRRFMQDYGLPAYDAGVLVAEQATADYYEAVAKGRDAKIAANWVMGDLFAALNRAGRTIADSPVSAAVTRQAARSDGGQHDQRPHRQGRVRGDG